MAVGTPKTSEAKVTRSRGRPPLTPEDIADRRARIIEAAARAFFVAGYSDTSIDAVARDAGITKRTIYELFGDKRALFSAACSKLRAEGPRFRFDVPVEGRTAREVMLDMARQLLVHSLDPELLALERALAVEAAQHPGLVAGVVVEGREILEAAVGRIFDRLAQAGEMPRLGDRAPGVFYDVMVGARGFRAIYGHPLEGPDDRDLGDRVDMFLHGYAARRHAN